VDLGPSEVVVILIVVFLLFGAKRLPDLARGMGQALRIFKEETRPGSGNSSSGVSDSSGEPRPTTGESQGPAGPDSHRI
jgi:sec-independent protein translocase protein TatA